MAKKYRYGLALIIAVVAATVCLQAVLGIFQFIKQSALGLPIEFARGEAYYTGLDENQLLYRPAGTFLFHNQYSLISLICSTLLLYTTPFSKNKLVYAIHKSIATLGFIMVVLTQSRIAWLSLLIISIFFFKKNNYLRIISWRKVGAMLALASPLLGLVVFPRIALSFNTFYQGAGLWLRLRMIDEGFKALLQSPLVGYGVGTNEYVLHSLFPHGIMSVFPAAVHMAYLQVALEVGILGLLSFVAPFIWVLVLTRNSQSVKQWPELDISKAFRACLIVFSLYYAVQPHVGIIEFPYLGLVLGIGLLGIGGHEKN